MMGLGYDPDVDDGISGTRTQGRGVIFIDAESGADIWQVTSGSVSSPSGTVLTETAMSYSVPSDLAVVDRDGNGYSDRVYFGDTGGQLWRLDIGSATISEWKATRLFKFSSTATQRFLNAPDVVESPDGKYDMLIIGSGNREKPVETSVQNYMLFYRDYDQAGVSTATATLQLSDLAAADTLAGGTLEFDPDQNIVADSKFLKGWYLPFESGEKVVTPALTANETTTFATNVPGINSACSDLGEARIYKINPFVVAGAADGDKNYVEIEGGGFLPPPVGFTVIVETESCDGEGNCSTEDKPVSGIMFGFHAEDTEGDPLGVRRKVWWHNQRD
jgi:type IV pilus assembly protein PilY1